MPRRNTLFPRPIAPEMVELGDRVTVTYKSDHGITRAATGTVYAREDNGNVRHMVTREGATLFTWDTTEHPGYTLELLSRAEYPQEGLWTDSLDETRHRLAG